MTNGDKAAKLREFEKLVGFLQDQKIILTARVVSKARGKYGALYLALIAERGKPDGDMQTVDAALSIICAE
jgi:hypothetical protein